jgi:hypothetical protein
MKLASDVAAGRRDAGIVLPINSHKRWSPNSGVHTRRTHTTHQVCHGGRGTGTEVHTFMEESGTSIDSPAPAELILSTTTPQDLKTGVGTNTTKKAFKTRSTARAIA